MSEGFLDTVMQSRLKQFGNESTDLVGQLNNKW